MNGRNGFTAEKYESCNIYIKLCNDYAVDTDHICIVTPMLQSKNKTMKLKNMFPITATLMVVLLGSCQKEETQAPNLSADVTILKATKPPRMEMVPLGLAGSFVILSKSGITDVPSSAVTGDIGTSPITGAAILLTCTEVTGTIYSVDAAGPSCRITNASRLSTAVGDMQAAYTDAAGRTNPNFLNLGAGTIGGLTLVPGLYKWTSAVNIPTNITISGGTNDVWIFQVGGTLSMSSAVRITLRGGAQAKNIFWQTSGAVTLGTNSHFEGIILGATGINMQTGGSINGRLLAQTAVTLQKNTVTRP